MHQAEGLRNTHPLTINMNNQPCRLKNYSVRHLVITFKTLRRCSSDILEPEGRQRLLANNSSEVPFK